MKLIIKLFCLFLLIPLTGCWGNTAVNKFNNEKYLQAESIEPLKIPPELVSTTYIEPYYPAPPGEYPEPGEEPISELPPGLGDLRGDTQPKEKGFFNFF